MNFSDRWIEVAVEKLADWPIDIPTPKPRQIFLNADCGIFALVSEADYQWAIQWRWSWRWDRTKQKRYATRTGYRDGRDVTLYLHKEILNRSDKKQPTEAHTIGDHQNGESLDCQIENLEWATRSMNRKNRAR